MSGVNISDWMDKHSRDIGDLNDDERFDLGDACREASDPAALEEFLRDNEKELEGLSDDEKSDRFNESRCPGDYYPVWNTIWEFPSSMSAEALNKEGVPNLIFFDWDEVTWVGLTGCGMDLSPALYYAYLRYSDLNCNKDAILDGVLRSGVDYYIHVLGHMHFFGLVRLVGKKLMKRYGTESKRRYEEFDESLRILNKMEKEGKVDRMEKKVLGLMVFFRSRRPMPKG